MTGARSWPTRADWGASYNRVFDDELDQVADAVSRRLTDYATGPQIEAAVAELHAFRTTLGAPIREATATARTVLPSYARPRLAHEGLGYAEALDRLTPEARQLVDAATRLRDQRQYLNHVIREADRGTVPAGYLLAHAGPLHAPTFEGIVTRYERAVEQAKADFTAAREMRVPDDAAWQREVERRASVERYLERGPLVRHAAGRQA